MNSLAVELDKKLKMLDPETAASVERLIRDALALAEKAQSQPRHFTPAFWEQIRAEWGNEPFERPTQGSFEQREQW
jgi:hypothetical protein